MRFGVFLPQGWRMDLVDVPDPVEKYETMSRCALEAESAGFDGVFLYDHFHTVPDPHLESVFECWTSMAALARDTSTIRLGQMVPRQPAELVQAAKTGLHRLRIQPSGHQSHSAQLDHHLFLNHDFKR